MQIIYGEINKNIEGGKMKRYLCFIFLIVSFFTYGDRGEQKFLEEKTDLSYRIGFERGRDKSFVLKENIQSEIRNTLDGKKNKTGIYTFEIKKLNEKARGILFNWVYIKRYLTFLIVIFVFNYIKQIVRKIMLVENL